jgi:hypothetical protein
MANSEDAVALKKALIQALPPDDVSVYNHGDNILVWMRKIGKRADTPGYLLRRLASSGDPELRIAVADHVNTPLDVLFTLANDESADVRIALAENHNINHEVLKKLTDDTNPYVSHRATQTLSRLLSITCPGSSWVNMGKVSNE